MEVSACEGGGGVAGGCEEVDMESVRIAAWPSCSRQSEVECVSQVVVWGQLVQVVVGAKEVELGPGGGGKLGVFGVG